MINSSVMSTDQISAEQEATESLIKLLEQAKKCQLLYTRARMSLPEPLKRVLGLNGASPLTRDISNLIIPEPQRPDPPSDAEADWLAIPEKETTPTTVALALLRSAGKPMRAKDVVAGVVNILPNVLRGSINNIGTRLSGKLIKRTEQGWELLRLETAAILYKGYLWGPKEIFQKSELAAHRRAAILHVLGFFPGGLQSRQIIEQLKKCAWVHAPVNKDLVKADLEILDKDELIQKRGNSGKWALPPTKDERP